MGVHISILPILYSFRRCPYAMRGRLAVAASKMQVELREIVLRDKPQSMLDASPKGTVPVMILPDGRIIEESFDIMLYALGQNDPENLLPKDTDLKQQIFELIYENDGPFKAALDHYKYPNRYENIDVENERQSALVFLQKLEALLSQGNGFLCGGRLSLAELAIYPFVRQFSRVNLVWFEAQNLPNLIAALDQFLSSERFLSIMNKYPKWVEGDEPMVFAA